MGEGTIQSNLCNPIIEIPLSSNDSNEDIEEEENEEQHNDNSFDGVVEAIDNLSLTRIDSKDEPPTRPVIRRYQLGTDELYHRNTERDEDFERLLESCKRNIMSLY